MAEVVEVIEVIEVIEGAIPEALALAALALATLALATLALATLALLAAVEEKMLMWFVPQPSRHRCQEQRPELP